MKVLKHEYFALYRETTYEQWGPMLSYMLTNFRPCAVNEKLAHYMRLLDCFLHRKYFIIWQKPWLAETMSWRDTDLFGWYLQCKEQMHIWATKLPIFLSGSSPGGPALCAHRQHPRRPSLPASLSPAPPNSSSIPLSCDSHRGMAPDSLSYLSLFAQWGSHIPPTPNVMTLKLICLPWICRKTCGLSLRCYFHCLNKFHLWNKRTQCAKWFISAQWSSGYHDTASVLAERIFPAERNSLGLWSIMLPSTIPIPLTLASWRPHFSSRLRPRLFKSYVPQKCVSPLSGTAPSSYYTCRIVWSLEAIQVEACP